MSGTQSATFHKKRGKNIEMSIKSGLRKSLVTSVFARGCWIVKNRLIAWTAEMLLTLKSLTQKVKKSLYKAFTGFIVISKWHFMRGFSGTESAIFIFWSDLTPIYKDGE